MLSCRGCGSELSLKDVVADLGAMPVANGLLTENDLFQPETHYPLLALVCRRCLLVQLPSLVDPKTLFPDTYPFRSGMSGAWLAHCKGFADDAVKRFGLGPLSRVLEIGSNDGMGLVRFRHHGIPSLGIEPCQEVALEALGMGVATVTDWWTSDYARKLKDSDFQADLVIGRNVLAHVPDLQDFLYGVRTILTPGGTAVFEVPNVRNLIERSQWDQIYHEHHSYFSVTSLRDVLAICGLHLYDVEHVATHGGSIRAYAALASSKVNCEGGRSRVKMALMQEKQAGLCDPDTYFALAALPGEDKRSTIKMLSKLEGRVVGYGASAKAATYLNYCGIGPELIEYVVDITPAKWGRYLPGSRIPIMPPGSMNDSVHAVINFCWNWPEESTHRIQQSTKAPITFLHRPLPIKAVMSGDIVTSTVTMS